MEEERGGTSLFVKIQLQSKQFLVLLRVHMSAAIVVVHLADFTKLPAPLLSPGFLVKCLPYTTSLTHFVHTPFSQPHKPTCHKFVGGEEKEEAIEGVLLKENDKTKQNKQQNNETLMLLLRCQVGLDSINFFGPDLQAVDGLKEDAGHKGLRRDFVEQKGQKFALVIQFQNFFYGRRGGFCQRKREGGARVRKL